MRHSPIVLMILLALVTASAFPYELRSFQRNSSTSIKWAQNEFRLSISKSLLNDPDNFKSGDDFRNTVQKAVEEWEKYCGIRISLDLSREVSVSPTGKSGDGVSLITNAPTAENLLLFSGENSERPAITRLFVDGAGRITEADIVLNPYTQLSTDGTVGTYDLQSTLVHEIGHALGLGHSEVAAASMNSKIGKNGLFALPFTQYRTLSGDDIAGARALYGPAVGDQGCCGTISGRLIGNWDSGHLTVWAEHSRTGAVAAAVGAGADGRFSLEGLSEGSYDLYGTSEGTAFKVLDHSIFVASNMKTAVSSRRGSVHYGFGRTRIGLNGQLSSIAVPVNAGFSYMLFFEGQAPSLGLEIAFSGSGIKGDFERVIDHDFGKGVHVTSLVTNIAKTVPLGEYTIRFEKDGKLVAAVIGGVSVETEENPWVHRRFE